MNNIKSFSVTNLHVICLYYSLIYNAHDIFCFIFREKKEPPSLSPLKHPHGQYTGHGTHPSTGDPRAKTLGNDNSSLCRQSRSQNNRPVPDVINGKWGFCRCLIVDRDFCVKGLSLSSWLYSHSKWGRQCGLLFSRYFSFLRPLL